MLKTMHENEVTYNLKDYIHVFSRNGLKIGYGIKNNKIYVFSDNEYNVLIRILKGCSIDEVVLYENVEVDSLAEIIEDICDLSDAKRSVEKETIETFYLKFIDYCNMSCSYCYIPHNKTHTVLDVHTGLNAVKKLTKYGAKGVGIHGGEHLLEVDRLKELILAIRNAGYDIDIGLSTNGTLVTKELAKFFRDHHVVASVGFDGDKSTYDKTKRYNDGRSSYNDALRGAQILDSYGVLAAMEMTVSLKHDEELGKMLNGMPAINVPISISRVCAAKDKPFFNEVHHGNALRRYYAQDSDLNVPDKTYISYSKAALIGLAMGNICGSGQYICSEIQDKVSVDIDGNVYMCPKMHDIRHSLGNVNDDNFDQDFLAKRNSGFEFFSNSKIKAYWFNGLIEKCVDFVEMDNNGLWSIYDEDVMSDFYEDMIYRRITKDEQAINNEIKKWGQSGF